MQVRCFSQWGRYGTEVFKGGNHTTQTKTSLFCITRNMSLQARLQLRLLPLRFPLLHKRPDPLPAASLNTGSTIMAADSRPQFSTPPPPTKLAILSFPSPQILLVTLNRPKQLNCINLDGHEELHRVWAWMDEEPSIRVGIITGTGRAFCAGADLKGVYSRSPHLVHMTDCKATQTSPTHH